MPLVKLGIPQNSRKKFECKFCDYITSHMGDYKKHLKTKRHVSNSKKAFPKSGNRGEKNSPKSYTRTRGTEFCTKVQKKYARGQWQLQPASARKKDFYPISFRIP